MKDIMIRIFRMSLAVFLITYGEKYFFELISLLGINISSITYLIKEILIVVFYVLTLLVIYFIYREDLPNDFRRFKRNMFPNVLMCIVFFIVITLLIAITNYLSGIIAESFKVNYIGLINLNIFNEPFNIYFILNFIKNILILPLIKCIIYVLGVNSLFYSKNKGIIFSGLIGALLAGINMTGSFIYIVINVIPYFILYFSLSYIYRKNNTNIWYSITTFILYSLLANILLAKIIGG